jgi:hypothetical protein
VSPETWREALPRLARRLDRAFAGIDERLDLAESLLGTRPARGAWSALEIAEHVVLANHYLLLLAGKIAERGIARARRGERIPEVASDWGSLDAIASREFAWTSPEHMVPSGGATARELRALLSEQRRRCASILHRTRRGEGALHDVAMSVVGSRLDLYQLLAFVALHLERHAAQMHRALGRI